MYKNVTYKNKEHVLSQALFKAKPLTLKETFSGSSPAPFVGKYGYPNINVGLLAPPQHDDDAWLYDAPRHWGQENTQIAQVVDYRTRMITSSFASNVKEPSKYVALAQEIAMATRPVDIDVSLAKKPRLSLTTDQYHAPMGPFATLAKLDLTMNPHIPTKVQKIYDDTDIKAADALKTLYGTVDENALSRMLSVGIFGKQRKLVPTRWSITATDDTLSQHFISHVRDMPLGDYSAHYGHYLGNHYLILFFAQPWSYELFEMYVNPGTLEYSTDYESTEGRTNYAEQCAGGYYTVRLAIAEHLANAKRQQSALVLRFITSDYFIPLGVWVTREAARKALESSIAFGSKELMLTYAEKFAQRKFGVDIKPLLQKSNLLTQKKLCDFT